MLKIGVLVSGGGTNLQAIMDAIEKQGIPAEIVSVISSNPRAYAIERAAKNGIEAFCLSRRDFDDQKAYELALVEHFKKREVGLVVLAGFMKVLGEDFVNAFENKIINIHPALIPSFCGDGFYGLHVHEAALEKGVKVTGATVHFVTTVTDGGPIILQKAVEVKEGDTPETLQQRVMEEAEWKIFPEAIRLFAEGKLEVKDGIVHIKE